MAKTPRGVVTLPANSFSMTDTKYIIKGNYSLNGEKIEVGSNSIIVFDGGSLCNGEIVGKNTILKIKKGKRPLRKLSFSGTFLMPIIKSDFFEVDETTLCDMFDLTSEFIRNKVYINDNVTATIPREWHGAVIIKSYTDIIINAAVFLKTCSFKGGNVFYVRDCHDVTISGFGKVVGDVLTHEGDEGESIYGVFIRNANNICINNITCEFFWGDGIFIFPGSINEKVKPVCRNIIINGVICNSNRRQGISVVGGDNIIIKNSRFINTGMYRGTAPSSGIDIEPAQGWTIDNILIDKCEFENNGHATKYPADVQVINNYGAVKIQRCGLKNFFYGMADNIELENCNIEGKVYTSSNGIGHNVRIINSKIGAIHNNLIAKRNVILINTKVGD